MAFNGRAALTGPHWNLDGKLSISGNSLERLLGETWPDGFTDTAFEMKSGLQLSETGMRLSDLDYQGLLRVGGDLSLGGKDYSRLDFDLTLDADSLLALVPKIEGYQPADVPVQASLRGSSDLSVIELEHLRARLGDVELFFAAALQLKPRLAARAVKFEASGPRLSELGQIGAWQLTDRPFQVEALGQSNRDEQFVEALSFSSGNNDLSGRLRYIPGDNPPTVELALKSSRLNLDEIRRPRETGNKRPDQPSGNERLFSEDPLPLDWLGRFNAELNLDIASLVSRRRHWRNLAADASLRQGVLNLRRFQVDAAEGKLNLSGLVKPAPVGHAVTADIGAGHAMIALKGMDENEIERLPHHAIAAHLSASGASSRELAASLNGHVWIMGGAGQVRRAALGPLAGDFLTELVTALNPAMRQQKYSRLQCQGLYLEIADGRVETAPALVIQTEHSSILATGTVDLATEAIDFVFETTPRKGIGISLGDYTNPFVKPAGTLNAPKIILNPQRALIEGSAAVATYGASVMVKGLLKRLLGPKDICSKIANDAAGIRKRKASGPVPDVGQLLAGTFKPGTVSEPDLKQDKTPEQSQSLLDEPQEW